MSKNENTADSSTVTSYSYQSIDIDKLVPTKPLKSTSVSSKEAAHKKTFRTGRLDRNSPRSINFQINVDQELERRTIADLNRRLKKISHR